MTASDSGATSTAKRTSSSTAATISSRQRLATAP